MKRVFALILSLIMALSCFSLPAFADNAKTLQFQLSVDGKNELTVNAGDEITVDFTLENITDNSGYSITNLQNEIEFDDEFFEFTEGDVQLVTAYSSRLADDYSWGAKRVQILALHVDGGQPRAYEDKQLVAKVTFKVKEGLADGASSILENKACEAAEAIVTNTTYVVSSKNLTVYIGSRPVATHTASFMDGTTVVNTSDNIAPGSKINIYSAPTAPQNKKFAGWKDLNGKLWQPGEEYIVTEDMTFTAVWYSKYSLSFDTKGGSTIDDKVAWEDETIDLSAYSPRRTGYTFDGWYSDAALTQPITSIKLSANTTIYAKWDKVSTGGGVATQKKVITFKTVEGTELGTEEVTIGTTVDLSKYKYNKQGYTFEGWYTDKELSHKVTSIKLTEDVTLYANWVVGTNAGYHPEILTTEHYAYIMGREGGLICPEDNITRAEVATIFFRLLTEDVRKESLTKENAFSDVAVSEWYNTAISTLTQLEILNGRTESSFEPDAYITRAEFTTIAARFSDGVYVGEDYFTDTDGHWAKEYINTAANLGWIVGENGIFRPDDNITRAEVMTLVNRVLNRQPESKDDLLDGMTTWKDNADTSVWYYLAVQEATNSHNYELKADGVHEKWTVLTENPNWAEFE